MMKRLAAAGFVTAALGGVLLTASPAMASGNDDEIEVNQEKVLELNLLCGNGLAILGVQKDGECGGSKAHVSDDEDYNKVHVWIDGDRHHHHKHHHHKHHHGHHHGHHGHHGHH